MQADSITMTIGNVHTTWNVLLYTVLVVKQIMENVNFLAVYDDGDDKTHRIHTLFNEMIRNLIKVITKTSPPTMHAEDNHLLWYNFLPFQKTLRYMIKCYEGKKNNGLPTDNECWKAVLVDRPMKYLINSWTTCSTWFGAQAEWCTTLSLPWDWLSVEYTDKLLFW